VKINVGNFLVRAPSVTDCHFTLLSAIYAVIIMPSVPEAPLKAGHPPAVRAGGLRISQHKNALSSPSEPASHSDDEPVVSTSPPKNLKQIINGVVAKGDADFPTEAVKAFHENKPMPSHDYRPTPVNKPNMVIQQPRK
jgi:hypothetical protein